MNFATLLLEVALTFCIEQLGAPRFRTREAMHKKLEHVASEVVGMLEIGVKHPNPEIANRCRILYAPYAYDRAWEKAGRMFPQGWQRHPWVWLESGYHGETTGGYVNAARESECECGEWAKGWPHWRYATRIWLTNQLTAGIRLRDIEAQLEAMAKAEVDWMYDQLWQYGVFQRLLSIRTRL